MRRPRRRPRPAGWAGLFVLGLAATAATASPPPFELKDGDRVVFLGGTFVEREQSSGHLEAMLTARSPDRGVTFRNLGWSGDTVRGEARARFGQAADGFAHLKEHVEALRPMVLFVSYGLNESFAGKAGLPAFGRDLATLLDVLDRTGARVVLITPRRLENLGPPLPDPAPANARLGDYVEVLRREAASRGYRLVDLFDGWKPDPGRPMTDNGVHLTDDGYREAAGVIGRALGLGAPPARLVVRPDGVALDATGGTPSGVEATPGRIAFRFVLDRLPLAPDPATTASPPGGIPALTLVLGDAGPVGRRLRIDRGVAIELDRAGDPAEIGLFHGPDIDQAARLRAAIVAKNELYFHRWRPQNETYLFGFRKHEQGNNAREIPQFDPLVAAKEAEIAGLRKPVPHAYEITRNAAGR